MSQETNENVKPFINDVNVTGWLQRVFMNEGKDNLVNVKMVLLRSERRSDNTAQGERNGKKFTYKLGMKQNQKNYYLPVQFWADKAKDAELLATLEHQAEIAKKNFEKKAAAREAGVRNSASDYEQTILVNVKGHLMSTFEEFERKENTKIGEWEGKEETQALRSFIKTTPADITVGEAIYKTNAQTGELELKDGKRQYADGIESNTAHIKGNVSHVKDLGEGKGWELNVVVNRSRPITKEEMAYVDKANDFEEKNWKEYTTKDDVKFQVKRIENQKVDEEHPDKYIYLVPEAQTIKMNVPASLLKSDKGDMKKMAALLQSGDICAKGGSLEIEGRVHNRKTVTRGEIIDDVFKSKEFRTMEVDIHKFIGFTPKMAKTEAQEQTQEVEEKKSSRKGITM